jgi:antitoxin YefM
MQHYSYTEARDHLKDLMDRVCEDHTPVHIRRRGADGVVMMAEADYAGLQETLYLLSNPVNAERLLAARRRSAEESSPWEEAKRDLAL